LATTSAARGRGHPGTKGWDLVGQNDSSLGKNAAQTVLDHVKSLAKQGNRAPLDFYKSLKTGHERVNFALQLKVDRKAAFMTVSEVHKIESSQKTKVKELWLTEPQVAVKEGLIHYNTDTTQKALLQDILDGLPSKPHERADLAAKGLKMFEYQERASTRTQAKLDSLSLRAEARMEDEEFEAAIENIEHVSAAWGGSTQCTKKSVPLPKRVAKELTKNEQAKQDFFKELKEVSKNIRKEQELFVKLKVKGLGLSKDKDSGVTKGFVAILQQAALDLKEALQILDETAIVANLVVPDNFDANIYKGAMDDAKAIRRRHNDTKLKGIRIIGK
jgi:hypothetical protein